MIGHIESYDKDIQTGVIKYEGKFYEFYIDAWTSESPPQAGDDVDFLMEDDGTVTEVGLVGAYIKDIHPKKSRILAGILALVGGWLGIHRFYLGFYSIGIAQIIFTSITIMLGLVGLAVMWGFIEAFLLFTGNIYKDAKGRPLK